MPFMVGLTLIAIGGLLVWGGISGRLADMLAAFGGSFTSKAPKTASTSDAFVLPTVPSKGILA